MTADEAHDPLNENSIKLMRDIAHVLYLII
jgi:hypothetical protein